MNFIIYIIIGGIAGALAGRLISGRGYGILMDIIIGIVGGFIGGWILSLFSIGQGGLIGSFVTALIGSIILLFIVRLFTGGGRRTTTRHPVA